MSPRIFAVALALLTAVALAVRLPRLTERPMHTDEAVNAYLLGEILAGAPFAFDPQDRHGPLLPAAGLVTARVTGATSFATLDERTVRLGPAVIGAAATGLFALGHGLFPGSVLLLSAALWSVSPLPVYYARYAIHETLLVTATLLFLLGLARATASATPRHRLGWALLTGLAAGLMLSAKLSALLPFVAAAAALALAVYLGRARPRPVERTDEPARRITARLGGFGSLLAGLGAFTLVTVTAYTWGFTRAQGLHDLLSGGAAPLARAAGAGHEQGPLYFVSLLATGAAGPLLLVLAAAGGVFAWRTGAPRARALVGYAATLLLAHSVIPYKTPWLALGLFLPLAALAAWGIASLVAAAWIRRRPARLAAVFTTGVLATATAADTRQQVFTDPAGEANPLAYAHTSLDLVRLPDFVRDLAARAGGEPLLAVQAADPWPLPFYLRAYAQTGFWAPGQPLPAEATVVFTTSDLAPALEAPFAAWRPHYFQVRPGVMLVALTPR